jgi:hypothetical protein
MWAKYLNPTATEFEPQNFQDLYNMFSTPSPFELPSPISDVSSSAEDMFGLTEPIDWDMLPATNDIITSTTTAPWNAPCSPAAHSRRSSSVSSASSSPRFPPANKKPTRTTKRDVVRKSSSSSSKCGRTTHNLIEKKYRTNLNAKITCLRDVIPSLSQSHPGISEDDDENRPMKINKGVILENAINYIAELEEKNRTQEKEMAKLRRLAYETRNSYAAFNELRQNGMIGAGGY